MERKHYDAICAVLFNAGKHNLIIELEQTNGARMATEIKQLKTLATKVADGNFNQADVINEARTLITDD